MIPIKLSVRNFMPYRDSVPVLDFTGIHTATISGENGAGKSSIIDAITWALWDKTRAKREDDLIHTNQTEMQVDFEFSVDRQKYRVIRKRTRPKRAGAAGASQLHFYIIGDNEERLLDGDTIAQTEKKIESILHMDYNTFTNSAYLRQGHADDFTTATPGDRKKVLSNILGLDIYVSLEKRAREEAAKSKTKREQLQNIIEDAARDLSRLTDYETELKKTKLDLDGIEKSHKSIESGLQQLRVQKEALEAKKLQIAQIDRTLAAGRQQLAQLAPQISTLHERIKKHADVLLRREEIETGYKRLLDLRREMEIQNRNMVLFGRLQQKKYEIEKIIAGEQQNLRQEQALVLNRVTELKKRAAEVNDLSENIERTQKQLGDLAERDEIIAAKKQLSQELMATLTALANDKARWEQEISAIDEKLHLLRNQPLTATCPMCGSELGADAREHIKAEFNKDKAAKSDLLQECLNTGRLKKKELLGLRDEIATLEKNLNQEKTRVQTLKGGLESKLAQAEDAARQLQAESQKQLEVEAKLTARQFATAEQSALGELESEISALNYDPAQYETLQGQIKEFSRYEASKQLLDEAVRLLDDEQSSQRSLEEIALAVQKNIEENEREKSVLEPQMQTLGDLQLKLADQEAELKNSQQRQLQARQQFGSIEQQIRGLKELAEKQAERKEQLQKSEQEEQVYRELAEAFGKDGVQLLLIETAVPEIENEANRLLAKMTDGRMNVKLETAGATQKGVQTDTLDIKISDELGIRNYEMFSGGEAFRINFSIRIALSRLLARRAGAPLPTLIIDEGFGTQDAQGIEKLKEAIVSIQDDFEKILVITHIDELKDAFPARIEVTKTPDGSMISLA